MEFCIGYCLLFGGICYFGYWKYDIYWLFLLLKFLRVMEDKLVELLVLFCGVEVVDVGCGVGYVVLYMVKVYGLCILGIDVVDYYIVKVK